MAQGSQCTTEKSNSRVHHPWSTLSVIGPSQGLALHNLLARSHLGMKMLLVRYHRVESTICLWDIRIRGLLEILHGSHSNSPHPPGLIHHPRNALQPLCS